MSFIVYGLVDPRDGQLRYVGKTTQSLKTRLACHLREKPKTDYRAVWMRELFSEGLEPQIVSLWEAMDSLSLSNGEVFFIGYFKNLGCNLTNTKYTGRPRNYIPDRSHELRKIQVLRNKQMNARAIKAKAKLKSPLDAIEKQILELPQSPVCSHCGQPGEFYTGGTVCKVCIQRYWAFKRYPDGQRCVCCRKWCKKAKDLSCKKCREVRGLRICNTCELILPTDTFFYGREPYCKYCRLV